MLQLNRILILVIIFNCVGCNQHVPEHDKQPILEVEGKFLYLNQVQEVIPPNVSKPDSIQLADEFIRKWVTEVLLYEHAKRNVTNKGEIDKLLDDYKKSLIIHQYQQNLLQQRLPNKPSEEEQLNFYMSFQSEFVLKEIYLKGTFLILPVGAPKFENVRKWMKKGDSESLEQIEKYTLQHGLSYDYFSDHWLPFNQILKKAPVQFEKMGESLVQGNFYEQSDSLKVYMLSVDSVKRAGDIEPYETVKEKIATIIMNQRKADFMLNFEHELYKDAVQNGVVTFFMK